MGVFQERVILEVLDKGRPLGENYEYVQYALTYLLSLQQIQECISRFCASALFAIDKLFFLYKVLL